MPEKLLAIRDYPRSQSVAEGLRFLGAASYYRRFIVTLALQHAITQKEVVFSWSSECEQAFANLKACLSTAPILTYPDFSQPFVVETDASDFGLGAILTQQGKIIEYASRVLTAAEKNYSATEKECLGVV